MKIWILILAVCLSQSIWAQRASYANERSQTVQSDDSVKLTENVSLEIFVTHLKLDSVQQQKVRFILAKQKLRPTKGQAVTSPRAMSYERRRTLFEKDMKAVLSERQYLLFRDMQ